MSALCCLCKSIQTLRSRLCKRKIILSLHVSGRTPAFLCVLGWMWPSFNIVPLLPAGFKLNAPWAGVQNLVRACHFWSSRTTRTPSKFFYFYFIHSRRKCSVPSRIRTPVNGQISSSSNTKQKITVVTVTEFVLSCANAEQCILHFTTSSIICSHYVIWSPVFQEKTDMLCSKSSNQHGMSFPRNSITRP